MAIGSLENPPWGSELIDTAKRMSQDYQNWFLTLLTRQNLNNTIVGTENLTAETGSIATTTVPGTAGQSAGLYRISYYVRITTAAGVSSSVTVTITWNDGAVLQTFTGAAVNGNTVTSFQTNTLLVRSDASAGFGYAVTYASNPAGAMQYALFIKVEAVP